MSDLKEIIVNEIQSNIADSKVFIEGEGCSFSLTIVSSVFENLSSMKRQQMIYSIINSYILKR